MKLMNVLFVFLLSVVVLTGCNKLADSNEVMGEVIDFNEQGMQIEKADRWEDEEGTYTSTGSDNEIMDIFFSEETIFEIHEITILDGKEVVDVSNGDLNDLSMPDSSVTIFGKRQNGEFVAKKVEIWTLTN